MRRLSNHIGTLCLAGALTASGQSMNIEQTLSDQAQSMTIAFDGLAFLTGSLGADSFLPPGKVADFSGFQYLRDNDPTQLGHNTEFVTVIARNVLAILSSTQVSQLVARAESQIGPINAYGYGRFPLLAAFRRSLTNSPAAELDWAAVVRCSADLYALDGLISLDRAQLFGDILRNLTPGQKAALDALAQLNGIGNWPQNPADPLAGLHLSPEISVGVMTYASEMYSWYAGSVEADTYFCPERQGTYFGSFYLKDAPAMSSTNYTIDPNLTADAGDAFLALLTPVQRQAVTNLVAVQKPYLYDLVDTRSNIATRLRQLMATPSVDTNAVLSLCRRYGELDGLIVYAYARHFAQIGQNLTSGQQADLLSLRLSLLGASLMYPSGAYLYSAPIALPATPNTDAFFALAATNRLPLADTGQTNGYTSVFGEDADYSLHPPAFTPADGLVQDEVTGRTWQQTDGGEMTWEAAVAYAAALRLGGYSDWRLPTAHELFGIVNHGTQNPALDTSVFTPSPAEYWWTSDLEAGNSNVVWVVNAGGGIGNHPKAETISAGGAKRFHVRCVRGAAAPSEAGLRRHFLHNADGTVTDLDTGLVWQQAETVATAWTGALQYAESLTLAGCTDWRLPNIKELQSLNDETRSAPSLDTNFFPSAHASGYWSSTTLAGDDARAWSLDFTRGIASYADKTQAQYVRCVRGGGTSLVVAAGASPVCLASGLGFAESPAADAAGNIFFSAVTADAIYRWSLEGQLSVFRTQSGGANGIAFDAAGNLVVCEGDHGRITTVSPASNVTVRADGYGGLRFNEPNDLWLAPDGGVYFTDPVYFGHAVVQGLESVYYLPAGATNAVRVAEDLVRPNGLCGTADGATLYVADWGASNVYRYAIQPDGSLGDKTAFASVRCDGMTMDSSGRLYFCESAVRVFNPDGQEVEQIQVPERPTNVEFGGSQGQFLFITTDGGSLYAVRMASRGLASETISNAPPVISDILFRPVAPTTGDTVWVTARITDPSSIAWAALTYAAGAFVPSTNTIFLETMRASEVKPWDGTGCDQEWIVTSQGAGNPFEQRIGANYGGNPCGLEFKLGTPNLADSMVTLASGVDTRGSAGFVEFWVKTDGLSGDMGWSFQLDAGSGFVTRLGELAGTNHAWRLCRYDLQAGEQVDNLLLRFQFRGGTGDPRIDLDSLAVKVLSDGGRTVSLLDDGLHQDGAPGDGLFGAGIPGPTSDGPVYYYLAAADGDGNISYSPAPAPSLTYSYRVFPLTADSVGDGLPDWWRARYFGGDGTTSNAFSCAAGDSDGDLSSNEAEFASGTDPTDSNSVFCIKAVALEGSGSVVTWASVPGKTYKVQWTTNLLNDADWTTRASGIQATSSFSSLTNGMENGTVLYRITVE